MPPKIFTRGDKLEDGHYSVLEEIGVGGMGVVYHCRDELLLRDVAIKMLLPSLMADKKNVDVLEKKPGSPPNSTILISSRFLILVPKFAMAESTISWPWSIYLAATWQPGLLRALFL